MIVKFNICDSSECNIKITDVTSFDKSDTTSYKTFPYEDTCVLDVIKYIPFHEDSNKNNISVYLNDRCIDSEDNHTIKTCDVLLVAMPHDGHYKIHHFIIPTNKWIDKFKKKYLDMSSIDLSILDFYKNGIYYIDLNDKQLKRITINKSLSLDEPTVILDYEALIQMNTEYTTLNKATKCIFIYCRLMNCYINLCRKVLELSDLRCANKNINAGDLILKRDLAWMLINVIRYSLEKHKYEQALKLYEELMACNGICTEVENDCNKGRSGRVIVSNNSSSCGCH